MQIDSKLVTVMITCSIKQGMMETALRELKAVIKIVMAKEQACHGIYVHVEPKNAQRLLIIEYWESEEVFNGPHMQTDHMQAFLKKAGEFLDGVAEFSFWNEVFVAPGDVR